MNMLEERRSSEICLPVAFIGIYLEYDGGVRVGQVARQLVVLQPRPTSLVPHDAFQGSKTELVHTKPHH